ncbi:MAG: endo-1,4-beta-xylanase [Bacteroidota bacterium]
MKKILFNIILLHLAICMAGLQAQDAYHTQLQTDLQATYGLPAGNWVFYTNESDIMGNFTHYGSSYAISDVTGQDFVKKGRITVSSVGANPFSSGWSIRNQANIQTGDRVLLTFFIRSEGGQGKVNLFAQHPTNYEKEIFFTLPVDTVWRQYFIPFESQKTYLLNGLEFGLHLGYQAQVIEIGGFTALNYQQSTPLASLPSQINNEFYGGWEANAPWRAEAAIRIDSLRKRNFRLEIKDSNGQPISNGTVSLNMLQHEFAWGSAITANKIAGNNAQNVIYENKILNLDGEGHGFNWVVFENDMKWPAWESGWFVTKPELANAVSWLRSHDITIRGHTLVWPGADNLPNDVASNLNDPAYVKNRINGHLNSILNYPGIKGEVEEWDVLNEIITNNSMENAFKGKPGYPTGREILAEIFQQVRVEDSLTGLWINDYITLSQQQEAGAPQYDSLKAFIQELLDAGVDMEGIGFQCHIGGFPNGIPTVLQTWDDFHQAFGLKAKVTEFDMPSFVDETVAATYLRDFLTATFSHPSMDGFLFWNFWDGSTWLNAGTNLFRQDWSATPAADTFSHYLFTEWWTEEELTTDQNGIQEIRAFKGKYEIVYQCENSVVRDTIFLSDDLTYTISCDNITTSVPEDLESRINVYPNPARHQLHIELEMAQQARLLVIDLHGKSMITSHFTGQTLQVSVADWPRGMYVLLIETEGRQYQKRFVLE